MSIRKDPSQRSNREKPKYSDLNIVWDGVTRGPELPEDYEWCPRTQSWWTTIRNSAQAMAFHDTDWEFLFETALLHNRLWRIPDNPKFNLTPNAMSMLAGEIRIRLERYGFSWADRRKYGIHVSTPEEAAQEAEQLTRQSAPINYRQRLSAEEHERKLNGLA